MHVWRTLFHFMDRIPEESKAINWNHVIWGGIIAPVAMSGCIELMQAYCTDTRSGDWLDFLANSIGVGLAALIGYYLLRPLIWRKS